MLDHSSETEAKEGKTRACTLRSFVMNTHGWSPSGTSNERLSSDRLAHASGEVCRAFPAVFADTGLPVSIRIKIRLKQSDEFLRRDSGRASSTDSDLGGVITRHLRSIIHPSSHNAWLFGR